MNRHRSRSIIAAGLAALAFAVAEGPARAGDADDVVYLNDGGRLRGVVVEEGPQGITIKLVDGTLRTVARARVKQVQYGPVAGAPPAAPPAPPPHPYVPPPPAPGEPLAAPPPSSAPGWRYVPDGAPPPPLASSSPGPRRNKALMITGIVFIPLGAVTLGLGAAACALGQQCPNPQIGYADAVLMATGSVMLVSGIVFTAVGASRVSVAGASNEPAHVQIGATAGPRSVALVGLF